MSRPTRALIPALLVALAAMYAPAAIAQAPRVERVRIQVERTRDLVEQARERLAKCPDGRAHAAISSALSMQHRAEAAIEAGRYLGALQLSEGARDRTARALRFCGLEEDREATSDRVLRRTDDVIARAHQIVGNPRERGGRGVVIRARELQAQAWSEYHAGHADEALRLTQTARALAYRALRGRSAGR